MGGFIIGICTIDAFIRQARELHELLIHIYKTVVLGRLLISDRYDASWDLENCPAIVISYDGGRG